MTENSRWVDKVHEIAGVGSVLVCGFCQGVSHSAKCCSVQDKSLIADNQAEIDEILEKRMHLKQEEEERERALNRREKVWASILATDRLQTESVMSKEVQVALEKEANMKSWPTWISSASALVHANRGN
jgi:hypothetical protein